MQIAYLSQGKLFITDGSGAPRQIDSRFGQELADNALAIRQRHEWKTKGRGANFMSGGMLWGVNDADPRAQRIAITGVTRGEADGQMLFVLDADAVGGLFLYDPATDREQRLFHKEHFRAIDPDRRPGDDTVACALHFPNGTSNIALISCGGTDIREITEGDSIDEAPSWVPGGGRRLVFQSAGVGRNPEGFPVGLGPFAVELLDLDTGTMERLLDDGAYDFLLPHLDAAGNLYVLRRPYEAPGGARTPALRVLLDILLFPFRMLRAVFDFLNFFSLVFSKKPLTTAGGPKIEGADMKQVLLRGRMIDAAKALREKDGTDLPSLVPSSWQLVRRDGAGAETVLARGVVAFDVAQDGTVVYSNGRGIFVLRGGGPELLARGALIDSVAVVG